MKLAPLQLESYALLDLSYRANQDHKPGEKIEYHEEDLAVGLRHFRDDAKPDVWGLNLTVKLQPRPASNAPYHVALQLVGFVRTLPQLETANVETLVRVNGASLLYGVAREVVRQVTSVGPFPAVLLPSLSFRPEAETTPPESKPEDSPAQ